MQNNTPNIEILNSFSEHSLPNLDTAVLGALELFSSTPIPPINLNFKRPLVAGSGNAAATGRIVFQDTDAIFATESSVEQKLAHIGSIDGVVIVSASAGKHAPVIAEQALAHNKPIAVITNTPNSHTKQFLDEKDVNFHEFVFPKNREPYTYNTSTYMGMILGYTQENPNEILEFIQSQISTIDFSLFADCKQYYFILPPEFEGIIRMLNIKFIELFGRNVARDIETSEYIRHATTIAPANEVFVSFGEQNTKWGDPARRVHVPLPTGAKYGAMMAVSYYVVGQIQKALPQYFKDNLSEYMRKMSEDFGAQMSVVAE